MGLFSSSEKKQERVYYSASDVLDATYRNACANNDMICVMYNDIKALLKQNEELMARVKRLEEQSFPSHQAQKAPLSIAR